MEVPQQASVIAGRYRLDSLIGEGGMAAVWRAHDLTLKRSVAVKLLYARDDRDLDRLVRRFVREARSAAAVQHRNVIHIVDFGTTGDQIPFMVMELLHGETLGQRMQRKPTLTMGEVIQIASLTLRGLAAVHEAGIVHRDLKPDNIYLNDEGGSWFPKILDFGISRSVEPMSGRRSALTTKDGLIVGTPEYMSPEQARGLKSIDSRTDIYSMGVILYEALTGSLPFSSENVGDLIIQIVTGSAPKVRELEPTIPLSMSEVIATAMARLPDDRFATAREMQAALLAAAEDLDLELDRPLSEKPPRSRDHTAPPEADDGSLPSDVSQQRLRTLELPPIEATRTETSASGLVQRARAGEREASPPKLQVPPPAGDAVATPIKPVVPPPSKARPTRTRRLWFAALSAVGVGAAFLWLAQPADKREPVRGTLAASTSPSEASSAQVAAQPKPPPAQPETVEVVLSGIPKGARVTLDGEPVEGDHLRIPREDKNRIIRVEADGKAPWQVVHHASTTARYDVLLADEKPKRPPRTAKRSTATTATGTKHSPTLRHKPRAKPPAALRRLDF